MAYIAEAAAPDLKADGYAEHEFEATGTASAYKAVGALGKDGRWKFAPGTKAPYRTRVLVRAPADPAKFSGTVIVEWLNVSAGVDADPEWVMAHEEIVRAGDAWVGVSAQSIGVEGGPTVVKVTGVPGAEDQGKGLKVIDPARYGDLQHPGDAYAYDIYTQVARAVRAGGALGGLDTEASHRGRAVAVGGRDGHVLQRRAAAHARHSTRSSCTAACGRAAARGCGQAGRHRRRAPGRHAHDPAHRSRPCPCSTSRPRPT